MMKKAIFTLTFSLLLFSASYSQSGSPKDLYLTKAFAGASFKKIEAQCGHCDISVSSVPEKETRVEVYVSGRERNQILTKEEIQQKLDEYYKLDVSLSGDVLTATARQKMNFMNGKTSLNISFRIYAAKDKSTELQGSHGNIILSGMEGTQIISTDHGNIDVDNTVGKLSAKTDHGNISVKGSKDNLDVKTDHGNIDVSHCQGSVTLITSNGNVVVKNVSGNIHADTDHGNISADMITGKLFAATSHGDVTLEKLSCSVEASTDHGGITVSVDKLSGDIVLKNSHDNISVGLPKRSGIDLDLRGGGVTVDAMENFNGEKGKDFINGTVNGGGSKVRAKTDKGQVSLSFK